jgi:hypothetical protein
MDLESFVRWSLESQHGDLGLGSGASDIPPLSSLGLELTKSGMRGSLEDLVDQITFSAEGNIAIARAKLDLVNTATGPK